MRYLFNILFISIGYISIAQPVQENNLEQLYKINLINGDIEAQRDCAVDLYKKYSPSYLNYYRSQLSFIPNHSILITNGLEDTYALTILQHVESVKKNVVVISLELLNEELYRNSLLNKFHLSLDFDKTSPSIYLKRILDANVKIFISSTVNPLTYANHSSNLFLVGLSFKYGETEQFKELNNFWKDIQLKDKFKFSTKEKGIYSNYLPPLLTLYKFKINTGYKDEVLKKAILYLAKLVNKIDIVNQVIKEYEKEGD
jgi:hypothetical protein